MPAAKQYDLDLQASHLFSTSYCLIKKMSFFKKYSKRI
ncbi:hypothetical protein KIS4809_2834 [Bacillus sp. ZZV12-4809]|nr:hypothetical protein KIS4809_2834 [Bacillus sp. ZZV12-4809]